MSHSGRWSLAVVASLLAMVLAGCASGASSPNNSKVTATATESQTITVKAPAAWSAPGVPPQIINSLAWATPTIGYACAQSQDVVNTPSPGLFKTTDGGKSWTHLTTPNAGAPCMVFSDPNNSNDLYIQQTASDGAGNTTGTALLRSQDGGATWSQATLLPRTNGWSRLYFLGSHIYALEAPPSTGGFGCGIGTPAPAPLSTPGSLVYVSNDGGMTWVNFGASLVAQNMQVFGLTTDGQMIYAETRPIEAVCSDAIRPITWRRLNNDGSWSSFFTTPDGDAALVFGPVAVGETEALAWYATPDAAGGASTMRLSRDRGASWQTLPTIPLPAYLTMTGIQEAAVAPSGHIYAQVAVNSSAQTYPAALTYTLDPTQAKPAWTIYAANGSGDYTLDWIPEENGGALTMWQIAHGDGAANVASLAMP